MLKVIALASVALLCACASSRPLPIASGPVRQLNVGHWSPGPNELTVPPS